MLDLYLLQEEIGSGFLSELETPCMKYLKSY